MHKVEIPADYVIRATDRVVEYWSPWSLPYTRTKPIHDKFRTELRTALATLTASGGLDASYAPACIETNRDIENTLFYNVGTGSFRYLAHQYLRFKRTSAEANSHPGLHYARYECVGDDRNHDFGLVAAECDFECEWADLKSPSRLWHRIKPNLVCNLDASLRIGLPFAVQIVVSAPEAIQMNLTATGKILLDGFISALHSYDGRQLEAISNRLGAQLSLPTTAIEALLTSKTGAVLGPCSVPHLRGQSVQWSPADHLLVEAEIMRQFSPNLRFTARAFAVEDRPA